MSLYDFLLKKDFNDNNTYDELYKKISSGDFYENEHIIGFGDIYVTTPKTLNLEIIKCIYALANTHGGFILCGIKIESRQTGQGQKITNIKTDWELKDVNFLSENIYNVKDINKLTRLHEIKNSDGRCLLVIEVLKSLKFLPYQKIISLRLKDRRIEVPEENFDYIKEQIQNRNLLDIQTKAIRKVLDDGKMNQKIIDDGPLIMIHLQLNDFKKNTIYFDEKKYRWNNYNGGRLSCNYRENGSILKYIYIDPERGLIEQLMANPYYRENFLLYIDFSLFKQTIEKAFSSLMDLVYFRHIKQCKLGITIARISEYKWIRNGQLFSKYEKPARIRADPIILTSNEINIKNNKLSESEIQNLLSQFERFLTDI